MQYKFWHVAVLSLLMGAALADGRVWGHETEVTFTDTRGPCVTEEQLDAKLQGLGKCETEDCEECEECETCEVCDPCEVDVEIADPDVYTGDHPILDTFIPTRKWSVRVRVGGGESMALATATFGKKSWPCQAFGGVVWVNEESRTVSIQTSVELDDYAYPFTTDWRPYDRTVTASGTGSTVVPSHYVAVAGADCVVW